MAYIYDLTDTWNAGGTTFNAVKMNVTDTASASASKLVTLLTNGTEHFSVTKAGVGYFSGNLGVGTNNPTTKIDSVTNAASGFNWVSSRNTTATGGFGAGFLAASGVGNAFFYMTGNGIAFLENATANPLVFATNGLERARIDANGNLGLGIAPYPWVSSWKALDINSGGGAFFGSLAISGMANNAYLDASAVWRYKAAFGSSLLQMSSDGSISILNAGTGSAGAAITFSTRIFIASSGNIIVGGSTDYPVASDRTLSVAGSSFASLNLVCGGAFSGAGLTVDSAGELQIRNNGTERMRLKAGGQVRFVPLASAPASPQAGDVYYDSTTNKLRCYNGTIWNDLF